MAERRPGRTAGFAVTRYGIAVLCVTVAVILGLWVRHVAVSAAQLLLVAVLITGWTSGLGPALLASALGTLVIDYYFTAPFDSVKTDAATFVRLGIFGLVATFMATMSAARRKAEHALEDARETLEERVRERTAEIERSNAQLHREMAERRRGDDTLRERASLLDLTHDTVFVRDMNDVITFWNRGAEERYGWTREEALGHVSHDLLHTVFPSALVDIQAELARSGRWEGELVHTRRDGAVLVAASRWALQCDDRGKPVAVLETNNDITHRKQAETELRASERRHKHIFQAIGVSVWEEDFSRVKAAIDGLRAQGIEDVGAYIGAHPEFVSQAIEMVRIVDVNEATVRLFGARSKDELLVSLHKVFTPQTTAVFAEELIAIAEGRTFESETVLQTLQGARLAILVSVTFPPSESTFDSVLVSITDITERKQSERALEDLAGRLIHAQEEERSRIGRELHDHVSQRLAILSINIDQLRMGSAVSPDVAAALTDLRQQTSDITDDIHSLSHRLHSSMLDHLGVVPALHRLAEECASRYTIPIAFTHAPVPAPVPPDVALCLFRIAEECLGNIAKHSQARSARVDVAGDDSGGIRLTVTDDGVGFDQGRFDTRPGLGFVSMRERLRLVHGTIRVHSSRARGTTITVWVPPQRRADG
jgi:PAS domain S-box-containing protein